ncbi:MAG: lysylphosphatidylglycerol synthase domain-containing protein [Candidatus Eisenbacteria bacterium]
MDRPSRIRAVRVLLSAGLAAALLFFLARVLARSWREAGVYHWSVNGWWIAASFAVLAVYFPLVAWIWARIVASLGERLPFRQACRVWFLSQMGKYVPGKIWYAMGRLYLSREAGLGLVPASASTLLEILLVILAACGVFLLSLPVWPSHPGKDLLLIPAALAAVALLVHPAVFGFLLRAGARVLGREPVRYGLTWRGLAATAAAYAATWLLYGAGIDFLLRGIRLEGVEAEMTIGAPARILFFSGSAAIAWSIGFLSLFAPGGLGVREASLAYFLSMHLAQPMPVLLALVARIWIVIGELASAAIGWRLGRSRA